MALWNEKPTPATAGSVVPPSPPPPERSVPERNVAEPALAVSPRRPTPKTSSEGGELQGNIESAKRVDVQEGGIIVGDVKAGSITVAAGSRMRGHVEFGWEDEKVQIKPGLVGGGS